MRTRLLAMMAAVIIIGLIISLPLLSVSCKSNSSTDGDQQEARNPAPAVAAEPEPEPVYSPIDGTKIDKEAKMRRPLAIMVENSYMVRPQEGLGQAEIVFEGLSEAGITRFVAIFSHREAEKIGPVRSARNHFVAIARGFDAIYAHCGGSIFALDLIQKWGVTDFDQMTHPDSYWRVSDRARPHNLFTSTARIRADAKTAGISTFLEPDGFLHKDDLALEDRVATQNIGIEFSTAPYRVEFKYDRNTNQYLRYNGGKPHLDKVSGNQLSPKNVIIVVADTTPIVGGSGCLDVNLTGRNRAITFLDGKTIDGYWQKPAPASQIKFHDQNGAEIEFNRGQIWVEIVEPSTPLKY